MGVGKVEGSCKFKTSCVFTSSLIFEDGVRTVKGSGDTSRSPDIDDTGVEGGRYERIRGLILTLSSLSNSTVLCDFVLVNPTELGPFPLP